MPRLWIDGNESGLPTEGMPDLAALLEALYAKAEADGRVLCRVEVDGRELDMSAEKDLAGTPLSGLGEVRATTGTAAELYRSGIEGALSLADAMASDIGRAAGSFRQGDFQRGLSMYVACVSSMETFFQLSGALLGGFQSGRFAMPEGSEPPAPPTGDTAGILARLLDAQRREDWTLMADLLEYEVVPDLEGWKGFLGRLRDAQVK